MGHTERDGADDRVKAQRLAVLPKRAVGHEIAHLISKRGQTVIELLRVGVGNVQRELEFFLPFGASGVGDILARRDLSLKDRGENEDVLGPTIEGFNGGGRILARLMEQLM